MVRFRSTLIPVLLILFGFACEICPALAMAQFSQSTTGQSSTKKKPASPQKAAAKKATTKTAAARKRRNAPRLRRMRQAFIASTSLKPMARQLLQDRTPAAYAGVEAYARKHAKEDAGALAWLVLGYAHVVDHDYAKAIDPLTRAKPNAGDLGDYVDFYLATSYAQTGKSSEAIAILESFAVNYPASLLIRDAEVNRASALINQNRASEAVALLEKDRQPIRADLEFTLGRAYDASGQSAKAIEIFRNLYFTMPLSSESLEAEGELRKLGQFGSASVQQRRTRADLLLKGRRFNDAANEYQDLVSAVNPNDKPGLQLILAGALRSAGRNREAKQTLEPMQSLSPEMTAERLFHLGEIARSANDDDAFLNMVGQMRQLAPTSSWLEQELLSAGNIYLLRRDYDKAIDSYRELQQRFPSGTRASYAHWKVAWLSLRQGRNEEAKKAFEDQIGLYPSSVQVPAALYWRGRLAEEENQPSLARVYYQKISQRFRNYYYGQLARQRLAALKASEEPIHVALLDRVPPIDSGARVTPDEVPSDNLRVQKAELLANGALIDFAVRELQAAASEEKGSWLASETARIYQDAGRYDMAIEVLKKTVPNYFAVELPTLPRAYWEALFPKPYWTELKRYSNGNALDPYLVASLIRQESEFNPNALSNKNAVGLMQLLPKTGKKVAKEVKLRHFSPTQLFTPEVNLQLGTRYFRGLVDKFGAFEYALAAYNAGDDRVTDWLGQGKYRDVQEFVESIPFTETREYVQAIVRNANVYRQLYGTP